MLEQKDLDAIAALIDARAEQTEEKLEERIKQTEEKFEERIKQTEEKFEERITQTEEKFEERICKSEHFILDELERQTNRIDENVAVVKRNLCELEQYYRITRLENDNTKSLLRMVEDLQKEFKEFKKESA